MLLKAAFGTLAVFLVSSIWLYMAWSHGNRTNSWTPVDAVIVRNDMNESLRGRPRGWATTISYAVDGMDYEAIVDEYLVGTEVKVYVDPEDPTSVVGKPGARIQALGRPIIATVGSGLFAIVLILIAVSPKED